MRKKKAKVPASQVTEAPPKVTPAEALATLAKRPTIAELEAILNSEEDAPFEILPNGEVRAVSPEDMAKRPKPLTMRERLGGEYGRQSA